MTLTTEQQIEILKAEIDNLEFGKRHYQKSPIYKNEIKHQIQMQSYNTAIAEKYKKIAKLEKLNVQ